MAGLLPTPKSSVLPLPFQLILQVCAPRSPPTLGWSPILPSKVGHRDPHPHHLVGLELLSILINHSHAWESFSHKQRENVRGTWDLGMQPSSLLPLVGQGHC